MKKIQVIDNTGNPKVGQHGCRTDAGWKKEKKVSHLKCTGLAKLARKYCANFSFICRNCRLCNHRKVRCGYFERAVLPGITRKESEWYASSLGIGLEEAGHGRVRVHWSGVTQDGFEEAQAT